MVDKKNSTGFTLMELLIVILIVGLLALIAVPIFLSQRPKDPLEQVADFANECASQGDAIRSVDLVSPTSVTLPKDQTEEVPLTLTYKKAQTDTAGKPRVTRDECWIRATLRMNPSDAEVPKGSLTQTRQFAPPQPITWTWLIKAKTPEKFTFQVVLTPQLKRNGQYVTVGDGSEVTLEIPVNETGLARTLRVIGPWAAIGLLGLISTLGLIIAKGARWLWQLWRHKHSERTPGAPTPEPIEEVQSDGSSDPSDQPS